MKIKLISLFAISSLMLGSPLLACEDGQCEEEKQEEQALFAQNDELDNDESNDEEEQLLASCAGGKCPREMIERCRELKRLEREEANDDANNDESDDEPEAVVA